MKLSSKSVKSTAAGILTGIANGLFGGGGGMIAVPLLKRLSGYGEKQAHAMAIMVIAPVCAASALTYILGGYFRADIVIPASVGSVAGGYLGAQLLGLLPEIFVKIIFIAVMLAAGIRMLF